MRNPRPKISHLKSKTAFKWSIAVVTLVTFFVWFFGITSHSTLYHNAILSTSIIAISLLTFTTFGLYKGFRVKDDMGNVLDRFDFNKVKIGEAAFEDSDGFDFGDSILAAILSFFVWILVGFIFAFILNAIGAFIWFTFLTLVSMVYWIFIRALRMIFGKSRVCKGNLGKSLGFGVCYTLLFTGWFFGVIFVAHAI